MPHVALDRLDSALSAGTPDEVYLFFGENEFLKEEKLRDVVEKLVDAGTRDFNLDVLRGSDADPGRVSTALDALPLMALRRVVVIRDLPALKKGSRAIVDRYVAAPAADTVLVLIAPAGWKTDASLVSRTSAVEFTALTTSQALKWTVERAAVFGVTIEPDAGRLLMAATGPDLSAIDGELRKLRDYATNGTIDSNAVRDIVGVSEGRTTSDLIDLVCARDGEGASALVPVVLSQPKASGVGLVMALTTHLLGIGQVLTDRGNRVGPRQQTANLYAMMGEARSAPVARPWSEAVSAMTKHADQWDHAAVDRGLGWLADADSALKNTGLSTDDHVLGTLVLMMCARRQPRKRVA
ncbi:MAG: DNA polymerase III subunit delta [Gemmatimonadetes bacterium]|nr:DNA polymerase III subunit delta [Gemmatimonadota bacterium]